jgi:hypothetical protein
MTTHVYVCEHCGESIDRHAQTRLVTDELGLHFFHVVPDCFEAHKKKLAREAYNNAIQLRREDDHWFMRNAPKYHERHGNGG